MDEKDKPTPEEIQVNEIISNATIEYGWLEEQIQNITKKTRPNPRDVPTFANGIDNRKPDDAEKRILYLRNNQQEVISKAKADTEEISKNCPSEIQNKINEKVKAWQKSDIYDSYLHGKEKNIDEASERYFKLHIDSKIRRGREEVNNASERATKLIDDFREKQASIGKAKEFAVNRRDALTKEEPNVETAKEDKATRSDLPDFLTRDYNDSKSNRLEDKQEPNVTKTDAVKEKSDNRSDLPDFLKRDYSRLPDTDTKEKTQDKDDLDKDMD
jgi:hypothetical protein